MDTAKRDNIIAAAKKGMPFNMTADYVELDPSDLRAEMKRDDAFGRAIRKAYAQCMFGLLEKLEKLENWQAIAFLLTSMWPTDFGRKSTSRSRRAKLPITVGPADFSLLTDEQSDQLNSLLAIVHGRKPNPALGGDTKCLPDQRPDQSPGVHQPGMAHP